LVFEINAGADAAAAASATGPRFGGETNSHSGTNRGHDRGPRRGPTAKDVTPLLLFLLAYLGGALTIVSPCILPVLPFVFARADKPFVKSGLPLLLGMAVTFALVATLAAVGGSWVVQANGVGRIAALVVLALFGLLLLFPALADRATRPLVAVGARLSETAGPGTGADGSFVTAFLLGIATGLLWAPCAGPILGLILTGAALQGASLQTSLLLLAYAAGAATSLALALLVGGRVFAAMKRSLGVGEWVRRALGVAVIAAVVAIGFGLDTGFLTKLSLASTSSLEQSLLDRFHMGHAAPAPANAALTDEGPMPSLAGAAQWLNSPPLTAQSLRGKVVLVDFWTYSCINCLRSLPYVEAWAQKYKAQGLVVIGVHTPEFAFERDIGNVQRAVHDLGVTYPVAIDNDHTIWRAFNNEYWPAHYFIDGQGRIRAHHFGEGDYAQSEAIIQRLLAENGAKGVPTGVVAASGQGVGAAADKSALESHETYVGYARGAGFAGVGGLVRDQKHAYALGDLALNSWGLAGDWTDTPEHAALDAAGGRIAYRFHARDLHLVLGPSAGGKPVRFRVLLDGKPPGADHGMDIDANGDGVVREQRLYQLVRQHGAIGDRTFEIEFLDPGVQAFAFTFG
jgi:cytochrome c biogenesis protein CcdA/thiol-disulfide isomerase/thioredoxin